MHSTIRASLAFLFVAAGCARKPPVPVRIGLINVFGAVQRASGEPAQRAAQLAVDELNAAGGIDVGGVRRPVRLIEKIIDPRPDAAAAAARALVNLDSVDVIVGPQFSNLAVAAGAVAEAARIPLIAPMASSPAVTAGRAFTMRLAFVDAVQGEVLARFAYDSLHVRRAGALFNAASGYGREIVQLFGTTFRAAGGTFTDSLTFNLDDPVDQRRQLAQLVAGHPDAILLPNFSSRDSLQTRQLRAMGYRGHILGSDSWDATSIGDRSSMIGVIVVANWDAREERPAVRAFEAAWKRRYPEVRPRATAAATYDAVRLIADAATRAGTVQGPALAQALRAPRDYVGAFSSYHFDGSGDPARAAALIEIVGDSSVLRTMATTRR